MPHRPPVAQRASAAALALALVAAWVPQARATDLRDVLTGYTLTSWNQKDDLPAGLVYALVQDAEGYLWVGCDGGLYRFDGARFTAWETLSGSPLPHQIVRALRIDREGSLW